MAAGGTSETPMSDHSTTAQHPDTADAGYDAGHHDEHGHAADTLGPIDWAMWGVGVVGVVAALIVVACFVVSTGFVFFDQLVPA
jgi:hypothetical protein